MPFEPGDYEVVERTGGARRHRLRRPVLDHGPRPPAGGRRGGRAPGTPRGGGLDRLRPRRRWCARGAAQGPTRRRPGPRQDGRPRRRVRRLLRPRDRASQAKQPDPTDQPGDRGACAPRCSTSSAARRTDRPSPVGRGPPATRLGGSPGTPSTTPGRWRTAPTPPEDRSRGGARDRLRTYRSNRLATSAASIGRGAVDQPDRRGRLADELRGGSSRDPQVTHGRVPVRLRQLSPVRSPDQRVVREDGRCLAAEHGAQADLRGRLAQQVPAADDEVHALAQVVHDDSEPVCPVPVAVGEGRVAVVRDLVRAGTDESIHPALRAAAEPHAQDRPIESTRRDSRRGSPVRATDARGRAAHTSNVLREQSQP